MQNDIPKPNTMLAYGIVAIVAIVAVIAWRVGYDAGAGRPLSYTEKQRIAVEFMCSPEHRWQGVELFCGAQVMDGGAR